MDLLQVFFLLMIMFFFISFSLAAMGKWKITVTAWSVFWGIFFILAIAGTPSWIAKIIATTKVPNVIAGVSEVIPDVTTSTDIRELSEKNSQTNEKG